MKLKSIAIYFLGFIMGIVASIMIVEKQLWFWHVKKDRGFLILEVRKINLGKEDIDDLIKSLKGFMRGIDEASGIEVKKIKEKKEIKK